MEDIFGLWGYTKVVFYLVFLEVVVKRAHPYVAQEDVGGFKDCSHRPWGIHRQHQDFCAEAPGLPSSKASAESEQQVLRVLDELLLGGQEPTEDPSTQTFVAFGASTAGAGRLF